MAEVLWKTKSNNMSMIINIWRWQVYLHCEWRNRGKQSKKVVNMWKWMWVNSEFNGSLLNLSASFDTFYFWHKLPFHLQIIAKVIRIGNRIERGFWIQTKLNSFYLKGKNQKMDQGLITFYKIFSFISIKFVFFPWKYFSRRFLNTISDDFCFVWKMATKKKHKAEGVTSHI